MDYWKVSDVKFYSELLNSVKAKFLFEKKVKPLGRVMV